MVEKLGALGMTVAVRAMHIRLTKDSWYMADPGVERIGDKIPACTSDRLIYLGCSYSVWSGFDLNAISDHMTRVVERVKILKPMQKVHLLRNITLCRTICSWLPLWKSPAGNELELASGG